MEFDGCAAQLIKRTVTAEMIKRLGALANNQQLCARN
jgi:hypothetical protein